MKQCALYFAGRILPALIGVGAITVYTRLLEPKSIGLYALVISIAMLGAGVAFGWLRVASLRWLGSGTELTPAFGATVAAAFGACTAVLCIVALTASLTNSVVPPRIAFLGLAACVSNAAFDLNATILQAHLRVGAYGGLNLGRALTAVVSSLLLIRTGLKTEALLLGFSIGNLTVISAFALWKPAISARPDFKLAASLFRFGWPMSVTGALAPVSSAFDRSMLMLTGGTAAVGLYAVPFDFARQGIFLLMYAAGLAGQPLAIKLVDTGTPEAAQKQLRQNAAVLFAIALPAVAAVILLSAPISSILGPAFRARANVVMAAAAVSTLMYGLRAFYFDQAFELVRRTYPQAAVSIATLCCGIACSAALIPHFGITGAAVSSVVATSFGLIASIVWGRRVFRMPVPLAVWVRIVLACGVMSAALAAIPLTHGLSSLGIGMAVAAFAYLTASVIFHRRSLQHLWLGRLSDG